MRTVVTTVVVCVVFVFACGDAITAWRVHEQDAPAPREDAADVPAGTYGGACAPDRCFLESKPSRVGPNHVAFEFECAGRDLLWYVPDADGPHDNVRRLTDTCWAVRCRPKRRWISLCVTEVDAQGVPW